MSHRRGGFSLLEVLVAMSLFLALGASLVALMSRAMDFLESGVGGAEVQDKARDFLTPFMRDVRNVAVERRLEPGEPGVRFLCDLIPYDSDGDGADDYMAQRLVFVRNTNREVYDLKARGQALGGLEESVWIAVPTMLAEQVQAEMAASRDGGGADSPQPGEVEKEKLVDERRLGLLTLYRGVNTPVGAKNTLFDRASARDLKNLLQRADPLLTGVLHFAVEFEGVRDQWTRFWDSTRSIEPGRYLQFPWYLGADSLEDARDDISPRAIRVTFVFERTGTGAEYGKLLDDISNDSRKLTVDNPAILAGAEAPFLKVGSEWIEHGGRVSADGSISIAARGVRGTEARPHKSGEPVRVGNTVVRTILIPSYREDWNTQ